MISTKFFVIFFHQHVHFVAILVINETFTLYYMGIFQGFPYFLEGGGGGEGCTNLIKLVLRNDESEMF